MRNQQSRAFVSLLQALFLGILTSIPCLLQIFPYVIEHTVFLWETLFFVVVLSMAYKKQRLWIDHSTRQVLVVENCLSVGTVVALLQHLSHSWLVNRVEVCSPGIYLLISSAFLGCKFFRNCHLCFNDIILMIF